ncbi:MAG: polysaccharide export protein [Opitutales bacterium]|nr:polysaccharide export protein [Opitutales bacterium]
MKLQRKISAALVAVLLLLTVSLGAEETPGASLAVPDNYKLRAKDSVQVIVFGEGDLSFAQAIDSDGKVMIPLAGPLRLEGLTLREAERALRETFINEQILVSPHISVRVTGYSPRQFYIFGEVTNPGVKDFPLDATSLDVLQALSLAGSFTDLARRGNVRVTRTQPDGSEENFTVDVDRLMRGRGETEVRIFPDDRIFVPTRFF